MGAQSSLLGELRHRRVPQILGMYVAAMWLAIEFGDWVAAQFALPESLTAHLFVAMAAMLPAVAVFAWGHGAPGKDRWTYFEKVFIPFNLLLALVAVTLVGGGPTPGPAAAAATETRVVVNELGESETYEVARSGFHRSALAMFLDGPGDGDESWLRFGLPSMLANDLSRNPLLSVYTPFNSPMLREELGQSGFERTLGAPKALLLEYARDAGYGYLMNGRWSGDAGQYRLGIDVFDVETGELVSQFEQTAARWLDVVDPVSRQVREFLLSDVKDSGTVVTDPSVGEQLSESETALKLWIDANLARAFDNDYPRTIELLEQALAIDPTFAKANAELGLALRFSGQVAAGIESIDAAMQHDYKLANRDRFKLRANRYAMQGDLGKAIKVLEMWGEIEPENAEPFALMGANYLLVSELEKASAAYERVLELDPSAVDSMLARAQVEQLLGAYDAAGELVERYLEVRPNDHRALIIQAQVRELDGDFEGARESLDKASFLQRNQIDADLALATLDLKQGRFDEFDTRVEALRQRPLSAQQQVSIAQLELHHLRLLGRLEAALALTEDMDSLAQSFMPPIQRVITIQAQQAAFLAARGEVDAALDRLDEMSSMLQPPMDGFATYARMGIYKIVDDFENMGQILEQVRQFRAQVPMTVLDPFITQAQAILLSREGEFERAIELYAEAETAMHRSFIVLQSPQALPDMALDKAELLRRAGRLDDALAAARAALAAHPVYPMASVELARIYREQGDAAAARAALDEALAVWVDADPDYLEYREALVLDFELAEAG